MKHPFCSGQAQAGASGDPGSSVIGRGSRRGGGRVLPEQITVLRTRPTTIQSKKGTTLFFIIYIINYLLHVNRTNLYIHLILCWKFLL